MVQQLVTTDNLKEAQLASHMVSNPTALPEPSVYFQDFNFGATMWNAAYGNVDGGSVSGVGEAVADIAIDNVLALEEKRRKEDDPAKDASMISELAARQREEIIRIGRISATRAELIAFSDAMKTPEFRARFRQELRDQGVPEDQIEGRMDRAEELADLAVKVNDGTATPAEYARFDELEADQTAVADLDTALTIPIDNNLSVNSTMTQTPTASRNNDQATIPSGDDAAFMAMMESDAPVTASPDREGPIITADYNSNAVGEISKSDARPDVAPATAPAFSFDA